MNPIILIPARIGSTRLPRKALADIAGKPMIVQVVERVKNTGIRVVVATDDEDIKRATEAINIEAIMTNPECPSGSDRIYEALYQIDPQETYDLIVNVQGDMPTLDPSIIHSALKLLENPAVDIATLAARITDEAEITDSSVVKPIIKWAEPSAYGQAINFSRTAPEGADAYYHHIGLYAYRRTALKRFVSLPPSAREKTEKLEQLRALDNGMRIDIAVVDTVPLGVDTEESLLKARRFYE